MTMSAPATSRAFGALAPGALDRAVIALTSSLPDNWIGLRLAIALRRITTTRLAYPAGALDVIRWGMRLRLHPRDNGCEKNLLFTPQMYEQMEIAALSAQIERAAAKNRNFVFLDIGANVGLFSLFVAAQAGSRARIFAVEPERGNLERLYFNVGANPGVPIRVIPIALSDAPGQVAIQVHSHDRGGTRARRIATEAPQAGEQRIEARTLLQLVKDENIHSIDAMKIDIEGAEDAVLLPFFEQAPVSLWPQLILIEDAGAYWSTDVIAFLTARGYAVAARSKINAVLRRE